MTIQKGCHGSIIFSSSNSEECMECSFRHSCLKEAEEALSSIQEKEDANVSFFAKRIEKLKAKNSQKQKDSFKNLSIKAAKIAKSLIKNEHTPSSIKTSLKNNKIPVKREEFEEIYYCCLLIKLNKLNIQTLRGLLMKFGKSEKTALAMAHNAINVLKEFKVINDDMMLNDE